MKKDTEEKHDDKMRSEYDFSQGVRGRYKNRVRPGDTDPKNCKVLTTIWLDADVVEYLEQGAEKNAVSFQTQINATLREAHERSVPKAYRTMLLGDDSFVAKRVKALAA
jgi:uncharacterized protein (DUF4415 family)